jgi:hypothetical protein
MPCKFKLDNVKVLRHLRDKEKRELLDGRPFKMPFDDVSHMVRLTFAIRTWNKKENLKTYPVLSDLKTNKNYGFTFLVYGKFLLNNFRTEIISFDIWNEFLMTQIAKLQFQFFTYLNTYSLLKECLLSFLLAQINVKCQEDNLKQAFDSSLKQALRTEKFLRSFSESQKYLSLSEALFDETNFFKGDTSWQKSSYPLEKINGVY